MVVESITTLHSPEGTVVEAKYYVAVRWTSQHNITVDTQSSSHTSSQHRAQVNFQGDIPVVLHL